MLSVSINWKKCIRKWCKNSPPSPETVRIACPTIAHQLSEHCPKITAPCVCVKHSTMHLTPWTNLKTDSNRHLLLIGTPPQKKNIREYNGFVDDFWLFLRSLMEKQLEKQTDRQRYFINRGDYYSQVGVMIRTVFWQVSAKKRSFTVRTCPQEHRVKNIGPLKLLYRAI